MKAYPFLQKHPTTGETSMSQGMDLRDYFAGQALNLFATDRFLNDDDLLQWAQFSYRVADAMLKARENKHE